MAQDYELLKRGRRLLMLIQPLMAYYLADMYVIDQWDFIFRQVCKLLPLIVKLVTIKLFSQELCTLL